MSQRSSVSLPGVCVLALLFGSSTLAQPPGRPAPAASEPELATGATRPGVQLIGWSPDEQRYAFRVFSHQDVDLDRASSEDVEAAEEAGKYNVGHQDKEGFCKGYVDHRGQRFKGSLRLMVFERDHQLVSLPIQDEPRCTPEETAAKRLTEAKAKLAELGIDTARTGKELPLVSRKRLAIKPEKQPPYELEFVNKVKDTAIEPEDENSEGRLHGTLELYVHRGGKKQTVFTRKVDKRYPKMMGGQEEDGLTSAFVSPSGEHLVVLGYTLTGVARSGYTTTVRVAKVWGGAEGAIAQEK